MRALLGVELTTDEVMDAYCRLQFEPVLKGDAIECTIPSARLNVNVEVDLIEEAIRVIGYARVPLRDEISIRVTPPEPDAKVMELIRRTVIASGYYESITFTWISDNLLESFRPAEAKSLLKADVRIRKADAHLRPSILPGLLESVFRNQSVGNGQVKLFETGSTFWADASGNVVERRRLSMVGSDDEHEVRGAIEVLLSKLDKTREVAVRPADAAGYEKGEAGEVLWGGQVVGRIGRIASAVCDRLSLRGKPFAAELELDALIRGCQHVPQLVHLPKFPAVSRDVSLIVSETVRYSQIESLVAAPRSTHRDPGSAPRRGGRSCREPPRRGYSRRTGSARGRCRRVLRW
jgi:phenylalanyl-tRNA synthetase beta chain